MSTIFFEDTGILSDIKIVKMMSDYGFLGFGYYIAVVAELYKTGGKCDFGDLGIVAKNTGIDKKKLRNFIDSCSNKYTCNGIGIFQSDENSFWSKKILDKLSEQKTKKLNGEKGGRPRLQPIKDGIKIEGIIEFTKLEKSDFEKLQKRYDSEYGEGFFLKAVQRFDDYLSTPTKRAKEILSECNHYYHFRKDKWVIKETLKEWSKEAASKWGYV